MIFKPGTDPLKALADALWSVPLLRPLIPDPLGFSDLLLADVRRLHATIGTALASAPEQRRLVIVVDQFEELFTQTPVEAEPQRQAFIDNLLYASTVRSGRTFVIITMRADFYGKCARYEQLAHAHSERQELVPPLSEDGLRCRTGRSPPWPSATGGGGLWRHGCWRPGSGRRGDGDWAAGSRLRVGQLV